MSQHLRTILYIVLCYLVGYNTSVARERLIIPQWNSYNSDFRETIIENGVLTDSYNRQNCDTVNVVNIGMADNYRLDISVTMTNLHNNPYSLYTTRYYNNKGKLKRGKSVRRPIYGWVIGMKDMLNYNAVLLRPNDYNDNIYTHNEIELCIVSINNGDTIFLAPWHKYAYDNLNTNGDTYTLCIQYINNTLKVGSSWNIDMPLVTANNIKLYGNKTGLFLGAGAKVRVHDAMIMVEEQENPLLTKWNEEKLLNHFYNNPIQRLEGFWEIIFENHRKDRVKMGGEYRLGIIANDNCYDIVYLSGAKINPQRWQEGMLKGRLIPDKAGRYKVEWFDAEHEKLDNILAFDYGDDIKIEFIDENTLIYLTRANNEPIDVIPQSISKSYGSGFALTDNGYVATNFHVVDGSKNITLLQMHQYPQMQEYHAEIVACDTLNDIAILRIDDSRYTSHEKIPYNISRKEVRRGDEIFYLGYPVPDILSQEIKTADGKVTALYGFNSSQYMMSVNVDHGSSGSPVFDVDGNVVGIVVSGIPKEYTSIEANFAIRASLLYQLMERIEDIGELPENKIKGLSHPDKIEAIAPFVYCIEVEF